MAEGILRDIKPDAPAGRMTDAEFEAELQECHRYEAYSSVIDEARRARASEARLLAALTEILPFVEEDFPEPGPDGKPVFPTTWAYGQAVLKVRAAIAAARGSDAD